MKNDTKECCIILGLLFAPLIIVGILWVVVGYLISKLIPFVRSPLGIVIGGVLTFYGMSMADHYNAVKLNLDDTFDNNMETLGVFMNTVGWIVWIRCLAWFATRKEEKVKVVESDKMSAAG